MDIIFQQNESVGVLIARVFLGLLFVFQGYDALFNVKVENIIETYEGALLKKGFPRFLTTFGSWFSSCVEFVGGLFLVFGFLEYFTLYLLGINLVLVSAAFGILQPMWDMKFVFPRLILLIFLIIAPSEWNAYTLDNLILTLKN